MEEGPPLTMNLSCSEAFLLVLVFNPRALQKCISFVAYYSIFPSYFHIREEASQKAVILVFAKKGRQHGVGFGYL